MMHFGRALEAMVEMAPTSASSDAEQWNTTLATIRGTFARQYWDAKTGSFANDTTGMQTINALALTAGIGTKTQRASAGKAMIADVAGRGYALSVGAIGARVLLDTLSDLGEEGHNAALRVVLRAEFPGWGYMVASKASTCWEGWDNETSPLYGEKGGHYHGSHNHAWLCGGVGEWVYSRLGGILPASDGFATVKIAPKVSKTLGPAVVSTSLVTPRGVIWSNWTRGDGSTDGSIVRLSVEVPGSSAEVVLPLLGRAASAVRVTSDESEVIWDSDWGGTAAGVAASAGVSVAVQAAADGAEELRLQLGPGRYAFAVHDRQQ